MAILKDVGKITLLAVVGFLIATLVGLQLIFSGLGFFIPKLAGIKLGPGLYLIAAAVYVYFIFKLVYGIKELERRHVLQIILVTLLLGVFVFGTQKFTPQFFSITTPPQFQDGFTKLAVPGGLQSMFSYSTSDAACPKGFVKCDDGSCESDISLCPPSPTPTPKA